MNKRNNDAVSAGTEADNSTTAEESTVSQLNANTLVNCRASGLQFSIIQIKKLTKNAFVAEFDFSFNNRIKPFHMSIHGKSYDECLRKTEECLETNLYYYELSVHGS